MLDAAFANLTRWIKDGVAPPKAERIAIENAGTPQARVTLDKYGNGVGGYRTPYLEVPIATYSVSSKGETFCPELGRVDPFDWARLNALYGTPQNYATKVAQVTDRMVKERFITESDGKKMKAEAAPVPANAAKVADSADKLVRDRWLTASDAKKIKAEVVMPPPASHGRAVEETATSSPASTP